HPRPELHLLRLQRRAGKGLVHIARDRGRLEQAEIAVREGRYAAEGLEIEIPAGQPLRRKDVDRNELVIDTLLDEGKLHDAYIDAVVCPEEARLARHASGHCL